MNPTMTAGQRAARRWAALVAVVLLPLAILAILVPSLGGRYDNVDKVKAAVVNNDQIITSGETPMAAGRVIAGALTAPADPASVKLDWVLANDADAKAGLASGTYAAVVTIPKDFSAAVTSVQGKDPQQAKMSIKLADADSPLAAAVADDVARSAAASFSSTVTSTVLKTIFGQLAGMGSQAAAMEDGTKQLTDATSLVADGATQLADGTAQLDTGAQALATGSDALATGTQTLASGASKLSTGTSALASGAGQLADGVSQLNSGTGALASGASQVATGASGLSSGLSQLASQTASMPQQTALLNTGAQGIKQIVDGMAGSSGQLAQGAGAVSTALAGDGASNPGIGPSLKSLTTGAARVTDGLTTAVTGSQQLGTAASRVDQGVAGLTDALQQLVDTCAPGGTPSDTTCEALQQILTQVDPATLAQGAASLDDGINNAITGMTVGLQAAQAGATQVSGGVDALSAGVNDPIAAAGGQTLIQIAQGVAQGTASLDQVLNTGTTQSGTKVPALTSLVSQLASGTQQLADAAPQLADGVTQLSAGSQQLASGAAGLSTGVGGLQQGVAGLSSGAQQVASGATQVDTGVQGVASGAGSLAVGATELSTGVGQLAEGTTPLNTGAQQLASGASQLSDGVGTLTDQLTSQLSALPSYTDEQVNSLSTVVANPVVTTTTSASDTSLATSIARVIIPAALWLGALGLFLIGRAVPVRVRYTIGSPWRVASAALIPALALGAVQAIGVTALLPVLGIHANYLVVGLEALVGMVAFAALNQALLAWWGRGVGTVASLLALALQVACLSTLMPVGAAPGFFGSLASWLPLPHLATALSAQLLGATAAVGTAMVVLLVWAAVGFALTMWKVRRIQAKGPTWAPASTARRPEPEMTTAS